MQRQLLNLLAREQGAKCESYKPDGLHQYGPSLTARSSQRSRGVEVLYASNESLVLYPAGCRVRGVTRPRTCRLGTFLGSAGFGSHRYAAWGDQERAIHRHQQLDEASGSANACNVHGHDHARAWAGTAPVDDLKSFWGTLGCSCFAF